jgi:hypothetical protein
MVAERHKSYNKEIQLLTEKIGYLEAKQKLSDEAALTNPKAVRDLETKLAEDTQSLRHEIAGFAKASEL